MGLLDGLLGKAVTGALGGGQQGNPLEGLLKGLGGGTQNASLLTAVLGLVQQQGGLGAVLGKFRASGLGAQADSWVGTGRNMPLSGDQLQKVLGNGALGGLAAQLGLQPQQAQASIADMLPELVNQLTPNGALPANHQDTLAQGLKMLQGLRR